MTNNSNKYQRKDALSNTQVGADFEENAIKFFRKIYPALTRPFWLPIGYLVRKNHKFDLGCPEEKVIIECKSHTWTEGDNVPSAKLTTWDQAMLYFFLAPRRYKKIFVMKYDFSHKRGESLCTYYLRTHSHVIPDEVEFWEVDEGKNKFTKVEFDLTSRFDGKSTI